MPKIQKTYRLQKGTIEKIEDIRHNMALNGFDYSPAQIVELAVNSYWKEVYEEIGADRWSDPDNDKKGSGDKWRN